MFPRTVTRNMTKWYSLVEGSLEVAIKKFWGLMVWKQLLFRSSHFRFRFLVTFGDKVTKVFRNLCLHFARQDGRNGKKIPQLDWPKYVPKTRIPNTKMKYMEWMKQINSFFLQNVFENGHNWSKHSTTRKAWRGWIQRSTDHFGQRSLKFRMNLWGHRFSQNANHKLQGFLPYPNKDRNTFFGWCFGQCSVGIFLTTILVCLIGQKSLWFLICILGETMTS